ncbi:MAG: MJ1477/TM1410 family putative glycoside hydrolase [Candidatus Methanofastidiosia archaeon]
MKPWKWVVAFVISLIALLLAIIWLIGCGNKNPATLMSDTAVNLTSSSTFDDQNPAFSPNGQNILFSSKRNGNGDNLNIWKMNVNEKNPVPLTNEPEADNVNMPGGSWNGVINRIAFSSDRSGNDEIWIMNVDGSNPVQLTNNSARDWEPTFSPDGNWVVFQSDRDGNWEIYKIDVVTSETIRLTTNPTDDCEPNWSPVGDKIVFQSNRNGNWEIYTMNIDGTNQYDVTNDPAEDTDPAWSPDGRRVVYSSNYAGLEEPEIFIINADGTGKPIRVTNNPTYDGAPSFSPDGTKIAFESDRSGNLDIWIIASPVFSLSWNSVNDFVYQLQNIDLSAIGNTKFDLVIIDYSQDGSDENRFTVEQIDALKNSPGGSKLVLAYISVGEAEKYRWYWNDSWDANNDGNPDPGAPSWLGPSNPEWSGNYKVKYWEKDWQSIIYGSSTSYLDKVIDAGFDGVYLDIIDAYEYWGPGGESGLNRETAEQEMVDFVISIADYARMTRGKTNFGIFPQNGEALSSHSGYLQAVSGIGKEDTWYDGNTPQLSLYTSRVIANLDAFKQAGKLVLVIDYVTNQNLIDDFYSKAKAKGYVPYATIRDLDALIINPEHEPD